jgi:pyruvate kinase
MNNFHFAKIIAGVGPTLAKETVLSKVINMVDVFRISLSGGFDDNNKKYIDTIMKLDNSKTVMLETRGDDIRVKNVVDIKVKARQTIELDYSEYAQEHDKKIFIDAPFLKDLKVGQQIEFQQSGVVMKIKSSKENLVMCEVVE